MTANHIYTYNFVPAAGVATTVKRSDFQHRRPSGVWYELCTKFHVRIVARLDKLLNPLEVRSSYRHSDDETPGVMMIDINDTQGMSIATFTIHIQRQVPSESQDYLAKLEERFTRSIPAAVAAFTVK